MTNWLRLDPEMTLQGIPARRRHLYFFIVLFLATPVVNQAWDDFQQSSPEQSENADGSEWVRLQEMSAIARSLYQ
jgi:hypothetical protein